MTEEEFDIMIKDAFDSDPKFNLFDIEYDFTPAKISRETKKAFKRIKKTMFCSPKPERYRRRFAMRYVALALIGASVLTVGAYAYCSKYVFTMGDAKMEYVAVESTVSDKTSIEEVYELTYNLDGYEQTLHEVTEYDVITIYYKGTHKIRFSQRLIGSDDMLVNTENAVIETIEINGEEAIYINNSNEYDYSLDFIWTYNGYEFHLAYTSLKGNEDFTKEQLIEIARTIQIKK